MLGPLGRLRGLRPPFSLTAEVSRDHHSLLGVSLKDGRHGWLRSHSELEAQRGLASFPREGRRHLHQRSGPGRGRLEYRPVRSVEDMPICFSRPICRLAMQLNDMANDAERQLLLPFMTRLACADTAPLERERAAYIGSRTAAPVTFEEGLKTLEGALAIGRQAEALAPEALRTRMDLVQGRASSATSVPDSAFFSKIKGWLLATKQTEEVN